MHLLPFLRKLVSSENNVGPGLIQQNRYPLLHTERLLGNEESGGPVQIRNIRKLLGLLVLEVGHGKGRVWRDRRTCLD